MYTFKFLITVLMVLPVFGKKPHVRIIGGEKAPLGKFPHQVCLQQSKLFLCAGSILSNRWILSAMNCLGEDDTNFYALIGTTKLDEGGVRYKISEVVYHPLFNPIVAWNDLALLKTEKEISFNDHVAPIALGRETVGPNVPVLLSGWGMTKRPKPFDFKEVNELHYIKLKTIANSECEVMSMLPLSKKQICTLTKVGEGACFGDAGGGLVNEQNDKLIGVVSRGTAPDSCAVGSPDVHMRVSSYVRWIENHAK